MKNAASANAIEAVETALIIVRRPCSVVTELLKLKTPFQFPSAPAVVAAAMRFSSIALNHEQLLLFVLCLGKEPLLQDKIHAMVYPMPEYFSDPHAVHVVALAPLQDQVADLQNFTTTAASDDFQKTGVSARPLYHFPVLQELIDEVQQERRDVENWLPVTSSRNARWWYSAFHNVTAMVGAGVLSLPSAMAYLTWGPGMALLALSWVVTLFTLWQLVEMHELEAEPGRRFNRYHELGQYVFGEKLGFWLVVPQQLIAMVGVDIVYVLTGGSSLMGAYDLLCTDPVGCRHIHKMAWIAIFGSVHFFRAQCPNFNSISIVSFSAAIMSVSYSMAASIAPLCAGRVASVSYAVPAHESKSTAGIAYFGILNAVGQVAFAFAGHNVVLEIQASLPSTPETPSKVPMWRGCLLAYAVVALCYFPVAIVGYWAMGNGVGDNVLLSLGKPVWLLAVANLMVVIHVLGSYQIFAMPVFDMMESILVSKLEWNHTRFLRLWVRSLYVAFTIFVAMTIPFFGDLVGFLGGIAFAPTTFLLPCSMWLKIFKPKAFSFSWILNWFCMVLGLLIWLTIPVGGLHQIIIISFSKYKFYG